MVLFANGRLRDLCILYFRISSRTSPLEFLPYMRINFIIYLFVALLRTILIIPELKKNYKMHGLTADEATTVVRYVR